jgi:4-amino-4-deoxy-L-arabinose transferase-like glycosyltransferase
MTANQTPKTPRNRLTHLWQSILCRLDRWRILLLIFAVVYGVLLSINLADSAVQWDEVNHLTGGLLLIRGDMTQYFLTSSFYPPMYNLVTAAYFAVAGASVFAVRFVAVTFAVLSVVGVFEVAKQMYGSKTGLLAAVFFAVIPGVVWLSRMALIETLMIFVFVACMLFFYRWILTSRRTDLIISVAAFIVGAVTKYQLLVLIPIAVLVGMLVFGKRSFLKTQIVRIFKFPRLIATAVLVGIAVFAFYELYELGAIQLMWYAIQTGTAERALTSSSYPAPIFYLVEMTSGPYGIHPIALVPYLVGLAGIVLLAWKRKTPDKFLLIWFFTVYVVFSIIPNKDWRYGVLLFPVLAVAAANLLVTAFGFAQRTWRLPKISVTKKRLAQISACLLVAFTVGALYSSCVEAQKWVATAPPPIPVAQAVAFVQTSLGPNQSVAVALPVNRFNDYLVWFYLNAKAPSSNRVWLYPEQAADAYTPNFNITQFITLCQENNARFVLLYEDSGFTYFNSNITSNDICVQLNATGLFALQQNVGVAPERIFVYSFGV